MLHNRKKSNLFITYIASSILNVFAENNKTNVILKDEHTYLMYQLRLCSILNRSFICS